MVLARARLPLALSGLVVFGSLLYANGEHDLQGGVSLAWEASHDAIGGNALFPRSTATVAERLFVASASLDGKVSVSCWETTTAQRIWRVDHPLPVVFAKVALDVSPDGSAVFVAGRTAAAGDFALVRFDADTGAVAVLAEELPTLSFNFEDLRVAPGGERVYVLGDWGKRLAVTAYDAATLALVWDADAGATGGTPPLSVPTASANALCVGHAQVFALGHVDFTNGNASVLALALDAGTGALDWSRQVAVNALEESNEEREAVLSNAGDLLVVAVAAAKASSPDALAFETADGNLRWTAEGASQQVALTSDDSLVYVSGGNGANGVRTRALDPLDGSLVWSQDFPVGRLRELELVDGTSLLALTADYHGTSSPVSFGAFVAVLDGVTGVASWSSDFAHWTPSSYHVDGAAGGARIAVTTDVQSVSAFKSSTAPLAVLSFDAVNGDLLAAGEDENSGGGDDVPGSAFTSHDGERVFVTARADGGELSAWDAHSGTLVWTDFDEQVIPGDTIVRAHLATDGSRIYRVSGPIPQARAIDALTGDALWTRGFPSQGSSARTSALSPDGSILYVGHLPVNHRLSYTALDTDTGSILDGFADASLTADPLFALALSGDGGALFMAAKERTVAVDTATKTIAWAAAHPALPLVDSWLALPPAGDRLFQVQHLATPDDDVVFVARDAASGNVLFTTPPVHDIDPGDVAVAPDGSRLFLAGTARESGASASDLVVLAFETATGAIAWRNDVDLAEVDAAFALVLSADGNTLFATGTSGLAPGGADASAPPAQGDFATIAFDAHGGARLWHATFDGPAAGDDAAGAVALDPAGRRLFVAGSAASAQGPSDLGLVAYDVPTLVTNREIVSASAGGTTRFSLRPGASSALDLYRLLGSASGTEPAIPLGNGFELPLVPDAYFYFSALGGRPLSGFKGSLDVNGLAHAALTLPPSLDPSFVGLRLHHAFFAVDLAGGVVEHVSNTVELVLEP